jgi:transcriptional regulator with XRE-family HTH domain
MHKRLARDAEKNFRQISAQIQEARHALKITQEALAEELGVSTDMVKAIEQNRRLAGLGLLFQICKRLGIKVEIG